MVQEVLPRGGAFFFLLEKENGTVDKRPVRYYYIKNIAV
ncbi:hypothetical protein B14911_13932 [Bacillus sp. NRRL B-14911]|nr:hypothetical protein B14911_13932 [Bacillus sp. NRRL B-14911]